MARSCQSWNDSEYMLTLTPNINVKLSQLAGRQSVKLETFAGTLHHFWRGHTQTLNWVIGTFFVIFLVISYFNIHRSDYYLCRITKSIGMFWLFRLSVQIFNQYYMIDMCKLIAFRLVWYWLKIGEISEPCWKKAGATPHVMIKKHL